MDVMCKAEVALCISILHIHISKRTHSHQWQGPGDTPGQLVWGAEVVGFKIEALHKLRARERTDWIWLIILTQ